MTAPLSQQWTDEEIARLDAIISVRCITKADFALFPGRTDVSISGKASKRRVMLNLSQFGRGRPRTVRIPKPKAPMDIVASCSDALLRRQLETRQVPSWPALVEHWTRHGRPSVSEALAA